MTKTMLAILIFLFTVTNISAQKNTYIGGEASITDDIYQIGDYGNSLKQVRLITGLWGVNIRQDITGKVFLEIGLLRKYYDEGVGFKTIDGYFESNAIDAWLIPLRLGTRINVKKEKISLVPVLGIVYGINSDYGYGNGGASGEVTFGSKTVDYSYTSYYDFTKHPLFIQTGLGFECKLFQTVLLSFSANYYTGMKKLIQQNITYTIDGVQGNGISISKGDIFGAGIAIKYPISRIWIKTKESPHR
jgi:hypothetical protein